MEKQKVTCPCCKSTYTVRVEKRNDNDIIGSGFSSWITEAYNICLDCGVYFKSQEQLIKFREAAEKNSKSVKH